MYLKNVVCQLHVLRISGPALGSGELGKHQDAMAPELESEDRTCSYMTFLNGCEKEWCRGTTSRIGRVGRTGCAAQSSVLLVCLNYIQLNWRR